MTILNKLALSATLLVASVGPTFAFWKCEVPEIDGPAGISALALIVSAGMIAYDRIRR